MSWGGSAKTEPGWLPRVANIKKKNLLLIRKLQIVTQTTSTVTEA